MKKITLALLISFLFLVNQTIAQIAEPQGGSISPLLNLNFSSSKNFWNNINPAIEYGWHDEFKISGDWNGNFGITPYVGSQIKISDSTGYFPAILLPGNAGIRSSLLIKYKNDAGLTVFFSLSPGLKVISGFTDTTQSLIAHDFKIGTGIRYKDNFQIMVQHCWAAHNSTSSSSEAFKELFKADKTAIQYLTLTLQTKLGNIQKDILPAYLFLSWRNLFNAKSLGDLGNDRFFSVGFRTDLSFNVEKKK